MLHRNTENSSPVWEINESQLAPIVEGLTHETPSFSADNLQDSSQFNESALAPTLLIGLDKSFFTQGDVTKDIIFIDNNGMKLNSSEMKIDGDRKTYLASGNYLISFVEADKTLTWSNDGSQLNVGICDEVGEENASGVSQQVGDNLFNADFSTAGPEGELGIEANLFVEKADCGNESVVGTGLEGVASSNDLLEQRLPLKKKAKMKVNEKEQKNTLNEPSKSIPSTSQHSGSQPIKIKKRRFGKKRCCYSDSEDSEEETNAIDEFGNVAHGSDYKTINDLVDDLQARELVDQEFADLILKGIAEMKRSVLEELQSPEKSKTSNELLVFAFLLHFKKPASYRYLRSVFGDKWPTRVQLKEWKTLVNSKPKKKPRGAKNSKK